MWRYGSHQHYVESRGAGGFDDKLPPTGLVFAFQMLVQFLIVNIVIEKELKFKRTSCFLSARVPNRSRRGNDHDGHADI